jgi:hypothetical protein
MQIPSNITAQEYFTYFGNDAQAKVFLDEMEKETQKASTDESMDRDELLEEIEYLDEQITCLENQVNDTVSLILYLRHALESASDLDEFKKVFSEVVEINIENVECN